MIICLGQPWMVKIKPSLELAEIEEGEKVHV